MRKPEVLTAAAKDMAATARPALVVGAVVTIDYIKADGTPRVLVGEVEEVKGAGDKEVVIVKTDKGYRSANLHRIKSVV